MSRDRESHKDLQSQEILTTRAAEEYKAGRDAGRPVTYTGLARKYDIKRTTLRDRVRGKQSQFTFNQAKTAFKS